MFGFKGVHHIALSVPSLEQAKEFYVDKLGFELVDEDYAPPSEMGDQLTQLHNADCHLMMIKAGNVFFEVFEFHNPTPAEQNMRPVCDHGYTHMAFEVEDINTAYTFLADAGVTWNSEPVESIEGYLMTYGRDPFGNVIEIQQLTDDKSFSFGELHLGQ